MSQGAGLWTPIVAGLHGEVSAETLEGYRRAGSSVYDLLDRVQRRRDEAKVAGCSPWQADRGLQFQIAFAWNAFVLQTLGDEFIRADYAADSSTVGFLPRVTAEQVAAFYHQVEPWVSRANQAASNPGYEPDVHLPAELPPWVEVEPCPRAHLAAMMAALRSIRGEGGDRRRRLFRGPGSGRAEAAPRAGPAADRRHRGRLCGPTLGQQTAGPVTDVLDRAPGQLARPA